MSFLYGAFAGVRSHLSSIGTGARNGERSRRHTISVVASASSPCPPLESGRRPAGTLRAENSNTDRAGRTPDSKTTKRSRHKSVTFSSVDVITHLPINPSGSAASSHTRPSKSRELSAQTRRNSTSSPTSVSPSGVSNRHVVDGHRAPRGSSDRPRRYTVSGPPSPPSLSSPPQNTDFEHASSLPLEENHHCRLLPCPKCTPSDWQPPSEYIALRCQDTISTPGTVSPLRISGGKRSSVSFGVLPSIDGSPTHFDQPYFDGSLPHGVHYNPYQYLPSPSQNSEGPSIDSTQGCRIESYHPQYSMYRADSPPVVFSPTAHFSGPAGRYSECPISYSSNGVEYTILPLTSRLSPSYVQHSYSHPECLALLDTRTAFFVPPHFPVPECRVEGKGIFAISHAPNKKGLGMFAQTSLRTGEVILTEVPTLIIPSDAPSFLQHSGSALDASSVGVNMYDKLFELLSDGVKKELMDLAWGGAFSDYRNGVNVYETIMRINPLAVSLPQSSTPDCSSTGGPNVTSSIHRGIFLKTSRCNHSCGPNAQWTFDPASLTLNLTCLRPINTGDEITIAYISPYLPFFHRRADLKNLFGFECSCHWCLRILSQFQANNIQSRLIEESDSARKFLTTFWDSYPSFETWSQHPSVYPDNLLISAHNAALEMIQREGLEGLSSVQHSQPQWYTYDPVPDTIRHTDRITLCYGVLADVAKFRKWVARALDARLGHSGAAVAGGWGAFEDIRRIGGNGKSLLQDEDDPLQTDDVRRVLEDWIAHPEAFPAWGLRRPSLDGKA